MVSLLDILKHLSLRPEIILSAPEVEIIIHSIKCSTMSYLYSSYNHTVKIWNEIDPSLSIFKPLKLIRPEKKNVFNIHDPKCMKRLFQLPVGVTLVTS